jgi:hypothetical protein
MTAVPVAASEVPFAHLFRLSDDGGLYEHARLTEPRPEHGYCVDDMARGLVVLYREPDPPEALRGLAEIYLRIVLEAQADDGTFHNRRDLDLQWTDRPGLEDCWGRALWGLGTAAARLPSPDEQGHRALAAFERGAHHRSPHLRAEVFAALGGAEVLTRLPGHKAARSLLRDVAARILRRCPTDPTWPWPEPRLRYANGSVPEVLLAAGALLGDDHYLGRGLDLLWWLLDLESQGDHLSVTPVNGWAPGEPRPGFDQQPIEVAALADACAWAYALTGQQCWRDAVERCRAWFLGANDARVMVLDVSTGGGYDGLERHGRNENEGAESTLAMISTFQRWISVTAPPR